MAKQFKMEAWHWVLIIAVIILLIISKSKPILGHRTGNAINIGVDQIPNIYSRQANYITNPAYITNPQTDYILKEGHFEVIVSKDIPNYENFAENYMIEYKDAYNIIKQETGLSSHYTTDRLVLVAQPTGGDMSWCSSYDIIFANIIKGNACGDGECKTTTYPEDFAYCNVDCGTDDDNIVSPTLLHEVLHSVLNEKTPLWANEGLASYFSYIDSSSSYSRDRIICDFETNTWNRYWVESKESGDKTQFEPIFPNFEHRYGQYNTAYCFWKYIKNNYGEDKFKQIVLSSHNYPTFDKYDESYKYVQQINNILGDDIRPVLETKFLMPHDTLYTLEYGCCDTKLVGAFPLWESKINCYEDTWAKDGEILTEYKTEEECDTQTSNTKSQITNTNSISKCDSNDDCDFQHTCNPEVCIDNKCTRLQPIDSPPPCEDAAWIGYPTCEYDSDSCKQKTSHTPIIIVTAIIGIILLLTFILFRRN